MEQTMTDHQSTTTSAIKVIIVDDHPVFREGLRMVIDRQTDMDCIGEAETAAQCLSMVEPGQTPPDVLVTDLAFEGKGGLDLIKDVLALHPKLPIIALSMYEESLFGERVLRAGGRAYLSKHKDPEHIIGTIRRVHSGEAIFDETLIGAQPTIAANREQLLDDAIIGRLTDREFEIFRQIGEGYTTQEIATRLNLSRKTVDVHRMNMRRKLDISSGNELSMYAMKWVLSGNPTEGCD